MVCDTFMPLWFSKNVSTSGDLKFNRFSEISWHDGDKPLFNYFCGANLPFEMLLLLEGED